MQRLLYISTARTIITQTTIDDILHVSRRNNAAAGITGLLIVGGKRFLQVLEGTDLAVAQTFERIRRDPRHFAMVHLARETIAERSFGAWAMGYQAGGHQAGGHQAGGHQAGGHQTGGNQVGGSTTSADPAATIAALIAPIEDVTLRGYFTGFADLHMKAA